MTQGDVIKKIARLNCIDILEKLMDENNKSDHAITREIVGRAVKDIENNLQKLINRKATSKISHLTFDSLVLRDVLCHRIHELSSGVLILYDADKFIPACILTRSVSETASIMFCLHKEITDFNTNHDVHKLNKFIDSALTGSRDKSTPFGSINIITYINKVDKDYPDFRAMYDLLSEYTHPNFSGTLVSFGKYVEENSRLILGKTQYPTQADGMFAPFIYSLIIFANCYNNLVELLFDMDCYFNSLIIMK